jgi:hypothetical protein
MADIRIHFRTGGWHYADLKARGWTAEKYAALFQDEKEQQETKAEFEKIPSAKPGDCWRVHWYAQQGNGPVGGYALGCPKCGFVHVWITASNCAQKITRSYKDSEGKDVTYQSCVHSGVGSCWNWSGSAEDGMLSASPSLLASGACGWHGWLRNGVMTGA